MPSQCPGTAKRVAGIQLPRARSVAPIPSVPIKAPVLAEQALQKVERFTGGFRGHVAVTTELHVDPAGKPAMLADVLKRMQNYANNTTVQHPQRRVAERELSDKRAREVADYLATVNLSAAPTWSYPLQTLPRPSQPGQRCFAQLRHRAIERLQIALLGPVLFGPHLKPSELDRVGLVAHLAGRDFDDGAFFRRECSEHFALQVLKKASLEIDIDFHRKPPPLRIRA